MNVSNEVRETYISWSAGLLERDELDIRAGEWDETTGMQVLAKFEAEITQRVRDEALEEAVRYLEQQAEIADQKRSYAKHPDSQRNYAAGAVTARKAATTIRQMIGGKA